MQKAQHFALPADPSTPIVMIGPGTGVAPFRAFLQERNATKASGRNWLFFGHQHSNYDFFYEHELVAMRSAGLLNRLTLAWSRDAEEKIYVQHRMREVGRDLWSWLADGAHIYVCGDALRMVKDVECALVDVVAKHGARSADEAVAFVAELKKNGRYHTDVYGQTPFAIERLERGFETICLPGHISFAASRMWENIDRKRLDGLQPVIVLQANVIDLMSWSRIREGRGWEVLTYVQWIRPSAFNPPVVSFDTTASKCPRLPPTRHSTLGRTGHTQDASRSVSGISEIDIAGELERVSASGDWRSGQRNRRIPEIGRVIDAICSKFNILRGRHAWAGHRDTERF